MAQGEYSSFAQHEPFESGSSPRVFNLTVHGSTMYNGLEKRRETVSGYFIPIVELTCTEDDDAAVTNLAQLRLVDYMTENGHYGENLALINGSNTTIQQFRYWLGDCINNHSHDSPTRHDFVSGPMLLIDAIQRTVVLASADPTYLALSYVWGPGARHDYVANGRVSETPPQRLEDAMDLATCHGYRFLWVDAICIPQDNADMKLNKIQIMDEIYERGTATMIGTDPGVNHGLYTISRNNQSCRSLQIGK